jgi:mono/diheme cytochrome c family protein
LRLKVAFGLVTTLAAAWAVSPSVGQNSSANGRVFTVEQATRGERDYGAVCASCHGAELAGGEHAPPLAGDAFLQRWQQKTVGDLFERIRTTMPQQSPNSRSSQAYLDIVAFILQANGFPAGKTDLPADPSELKGIVMAPPIDSAS